MRKTFLSCARFNLLDSNFNPIIFPNRFAWTYTTIPEAIAFKIDGYFLLNSFLSD
jgi:hypothetical protein